MCSHRLAIAKLVRDYKEPLFSHSPQISRQNKQELWEYIRQQAISQGATQYARKSWKEIRDCVWAPIRRDTMAKVNKAKLVGEDTVLYTEVDKIVLEIIGTNGTDGLDETTKGGVDYFNDENMQAGFSAPDGQAPSLDAYADSGPLSNASGIEHLLGHNGMDGQIGNSASNSAGADGLNVQIVDVKPGPSLSQMLEMFSESSHQNVGQNPHQNGQQSTTTDVWQQMDEMVAEQQGQQQRMVNGKNGRTPPVLTPPQNQNSQQQNALKRKASSSQQIIPIANKFPKINQNSDAELERAIKEAKLEQIHLQNQLLQEQIEEKRLQNEMLQMEIAEKKMELKTKK